MAKAVTYDEAPRPRVLLSNWTDEAAIDGLVPTVGILEGSYAMSAYRPDDWDAVLSVGSPLGCAMNLRVLQFGGQAFGRQSQAQSERMIMIDSVGTATVLTADCPDEFREEFRNSVLPVVRSLERPRRVIYPPLESHAVNSFIPLITDSDGNAFAAIYKPVRKAEEVIYLPDGVQPSRALVALAFRRWATEAPEAFQAGPEWTSNTIWMTSREEAAAADLAKAQRTADDIAAEQRQLVTAAELALTEASELSATQERLLLTADGESLADAVRRALDKVGFEVRDMDAEWVEGQPKREDLRVSVDGWIALVEVKGYAKGAKSNDLAQPAKWQRLYHQDTGELPDAVWFIGNHQRESDPSTRPKIFAGHDDIVEMFESHPGLIIDTRELFRLQKAVTDGAVDRQTALQLLKVSVGRLNLSESTELFGHSERGG